MPKCRYRKFKDCIKKECEHYIILPMVEVGKQTPEMVGHCADWFKVQLAWDNNRIQVGQQGAIESFRNEVVKIEEQKFRETLLTGGVQRLIEGG